MFVTLCTCDILFINSNFMINTNLIVNFCEVLRNWNFGLVACLCYKYKCSVCVLIIIIESVLSILDLYVL